MEAAKMPSEAPENTGDNIYINNAGLAILHPFLPTLFTRLGLIDKGNFLNEDAQLHAVYLLQYIATENKEMQEHKMTLNKLLAGLPIATPIPSGIVVTAQEKEMTAQLLRAVLQSWEKLSTTPPEGFRASFIQRDGRLRHKDDEWALRVEQRGYDILL